MTALEVRSSIKAKRVTPPIGWRSISYLHGDAGAHTQSRRFQSSCISFAAGGGIEQPLEDLAVENGQVLFHALRDRRIVGRLELRQVVGAVA